MFYKSEEVIKEMKKKIDIIHNGKSAKQIISEVIKYSDTTLAVAPKEQQEEFIIEFNSYKSKNGRMKKSVYDMEHKSIDLDSYVLIHKDDYESFLKFQKKNNRAVAPEQQEKIKIAYTNGASQRKLAKEFGISVATVNKIVNDKY